MNGKHFNIYAVKDELIGKYLQPVFIETDEEALRWFKFVLNNTEMWKYNAGMYSFWKLGTFDDKNGLGDYPISEMIQGGLAVLDKE